MLYTRSTPIRTSVTSELKVSSTSIDRDVAACKSVCNWRLGMKTVTGYIRGVRTCLIGLVLLCFLLGTKASASTALKTHRKLASVSSIQSCLKPAGATVYFPGSSGYETARGKVWQIRNFYMPAAIVMATSVAQVQNAVNCAVQLKIGISPRSGGHSYEDYSLGGRNGVLVVDLGGLTQFSYDKNSQTAVVGAGYRLGPLKLALWNAGKVTIPSGTCPTVGVGGHALGGGWGFVSRKFGIMADSILEVQVVIHDGSLVTANANQNSDLLQALKGAGANSFGIVTQFKFKVYDVSKPVTYFEYHFAKSVQFNAIKAYQIWGATAAAELSASSYQDPFGGNQFYGVYLGPQSSLQSNVQTYLNNVQATPTSTYVVQTDYIHTVLLNGGFKITDDPSLLNLNGYNYTLEQRVFKSKSIMVKGSGFSDAGISAFVNKLQATPPVNSYFIFDLFGGSNSAINKVSLKSGDGWVHRDSLFNIQFFAYWQGQPQNALTETNYVEGTWNAVRPYSSSEAYQNYIDVEEPLSAYYANNLNSLKATKRKWDSTNVFNFNQSIPLN